MFKLVFLFAFIPALAFGLEVIPCSNAPAPKEIVIDECPQRPCNFKVGQTIHIHATVQIENAVTALPYSIAFIRRNGEIILYKSTHNYDACTKIEGGCPLQPGAHIFQSEAVIPEIPLKEDLLLTTVLRDQSYNPVGCFSLAHTAHP